MSHPPACEAPVQAVALEAYPSTGQAPEEPEQVSATSHWPAEARQTAPALPARCAQAPLPLHMSVVQGLPSSAQATPALLTVSAGQLELGGASAMSWLT